MSAIARPSDQRERDKSERASYASTVEIQTGGLPNGADGKIERRSRVQTALQDRTLSNYLQGQRRKAEGAKTNTHLKATPITAPNHQHSTTLNHSPWKRSGHPHRVTGLGAISAITTYQSPLPSYKECNRFHSISGRFKVVLEWLINAFSSHSIQKEEEG